MKRRRVFRVIAVYGAVSFVVLEAASVIFPAIPLPDWTVSLVLWMVLLGFPIAVVLAWAFEVTPDGVKLTASADPGEIDAIVASPALTRGDVPERIQWAGLARSGPVRPPGSSWPIWTLPRIPAPRSPCSPLRT